MPASNFTNENFEGKKQSTESVSEPSDKVSIKNSNQQSVWKQSQVRHDIGDESATKIILSPEEKALLATGDYQKFEIVDDESHKNDLTAQTRTELLIASGLDKHNAARDKPEAKVEDAIKFAEGQANNRLWDNDRVHGIYRCNQFLDACLRAAHLDLPWEKANIPTVQMMCANPPKSWTRLKVDTIPKAGDIALWNHDDYHHCAILDGDGNAIYAGSPAERGWAKSEFKMMEKSPLGNAILFRPNYDAR